MRLLLGGDAMLGRKVNEIIRERGPAYPLEPLWPLTRQADLFFVNLECAITPKRLRYSGPAKAFYFRADPPAVDALRVAGVNLVSLANNHTLDADPVGLVDSLSLLQAQGLATIGAGLDLAKASRPAILEVGGQTVGVLACCDHQADFAATPSRPGICYRDLGNPETGAVLTEEVAALAGRVDHVVVGLHWQPNWAPTIPPAYRRLAKRLVEAGARVVWGHSPHHFQGVELIGRNCILYSCGDLVDDYMVHEVFRNDRQLLFELELSQRGVERVAAHPLQLDFARSRPAPAEVRTWILERFSQMCAELGSHVVASPGSDALEVIA